MIDPLDIMKMAWGGEPPLAPGESVTALIEQSMAQASGADQVAMTPEQKQQGLTGAPEGSSLAMVGGMGGSTIVPTDRPLDVTSLDAAGQVIDTASIEPGGPPAQISDAAEHLIETPQQSQLPMARTGGKTEDVIPMSVRRRQFKV